MIRQEHHPPDAASGTQVPQAASGAPSSSRRTGSLTSESARRPVKEDKNPWARFGWLLAAVWLVFLFYPIRELLEHRAPLAWEVCGWVGLGVFVILYLAGFQLGMSKGAPSSAPLPLQWWCFGGLIACVVLTIPALGFESISFLPFIMSFASYGLTRTVHWITLTSSIVIAVGVAVISGRFEDFIAVVLIVTLLGAVNTVSTFLIRRSAEADSLALSLATSRERESVARDVHDLMGHSLTVVKLKAQLARRLVDVDPERAKAELADIETITGEAIQGVRATVTGLRSEGLASQLEASRAALGTGGVQLTVEGEPSALSPAQALPAGWILREATTNVLRHAQATRVRVRIVPGGITVEDDGVGLAGVAGNGLRGMAERAAHSGGVCVVSGSAWGGVKVDVTW